MVLLVVSLVLITFPSGNPCPLITRELLTVVHVHHSSQPVGGHLNPKPWSLNLTGNPGVNTGGGALVDPLGMSLVIVEIYCLHIPCKPIEDLFS